MSVIDFIKGTHQLQIADWTPLNPQRSSWYKDRIKKNAAGIAVSPETAMESGAALACTRAISETLASLPAVVLEQIGSDERRKARENRMWALLHDQPNPEMDSMTWYGLNTTRVVNRGNALNLIEFNGRGEPAALWPVHNSRWQAWRKKATTRRGRFDRGELFYRIWPDETNRHFDVPPDEVLNIVGWDTSDGIVSQGVVSRARHEIGLDMAQQEYSASMFKNGALPLGLIKHPWLDDDKQREELRSDLNNLHSGRENWNKIGILWDSDADWVKLNFSPEDVQAIQSRQFSAKALCRYYNVPPAIVQIFEDYKFQTVEAMLKHFIMLTIRPYAVRFERAMKTQVLEGILDANLLLEFALEGLLRGDPETQAKMNAIYRSWGILDGDEIRQRDLNMNPLPDDMGKIRLAPLNHAPLELVGQGANLKNKQGATNSQPQGDQGDGEGEQVAQFDKAATAALMQLVKDHNGRSNSHGAPLSVSARAVVDHEYKRLLKIEIRRVNDRMQKGPKAFRGWIERYYPKQRLTIADALRPSCEQLRDDGARVADAIAMAHVEQSKRDLLLAIEDCPPAEFAESIECCMTPWEHRQIDWSALEQ